MGPLDLAPRLTMRVGCCGGAAEHRLVWQGSLSRADGPLAESERALQALGGAEPLCATIERIWDSVAGASVRTSVFHLLLLNHAQRLPPMAPWDGFAPRPLVESLRETADTADRRLVQGLPPAMGAAPRRAFVADFRTVHEVQSLINHLPAPWRVALAAELVSRLATVDGWPSLAGDDRLDIQRITTQLASGFVGSDVSIDVSPWHAGALSEDGTVLLPPTWMAHVWAIGAASIDRCLVLHLTPTGRTTALARVRARDGTHTRTVEVGRTPEGTWRRV